MLKGFGYLISTVSVILLGLVAWDSTRDNETMRLALIAGMASSVLGMFVRWIAHLRSQSEQKHPAAEASAPRPQTASRLT